MADAPPGISAAPKDDNLRHFDVTVAGPGQSPYEGELLSLWSWAFAAGLCWRTYQGNRETLYPSDA